jgi:hypothetical protein
MSALAKQPIDTDTDTNTDLVTVETMPSLGSILQEMELTAGDAHELLNDAFMALVANNDTDAGVSALSAIADQISELVTFGKKAEQVLAVVTAMAVKAAEQRDQAIEQRALAVRAYNNAFNQGIMHYAECDACQDDAHIEMLANLMMDESPEDVAIEQTELLNRRLQSAAELYDEWSEEDRAAIQDENAQGEAMRVMVEQIDPDFDESDIDYSGEYERAAGIPANQWDISTNAILPESIEDDEAA